MSFWDPVSKLGLRWHHLRGSGEPGSGIPNPFRRMPEQVSRLLVVFALFIGAVVFVRVFLIPPALKETGFHRASTIERVAAQEVRYMGTESCSECHDEQPEALENSRHQALSCETCHGPGYMHVADPSSALPRVPRERRLCPQCHAFNPSRPTGFPQINPRAHNPLRPCITCHEPHDPAPPEPPHECSACHAEIARTKAVSPHALLDCTVCHSAPTEHRATPRLVRASKPASRAFCGTCHDEDASGPLEAPRIDIHSHEPKYTCWQCHYPHLPEARP